MKRLVLINLVLLFTIYEASGQIRMQSFNDFFLDWKGKADELNIHADNMMKLIWIGGILTLAAASLPFVDKKWLKTISFLLTIIGASITQYIANFEVDPKVSLKKTKAMQILVEDFERKVRNSKLDDQQIAKQLLIDKSQLEMKLTNLYHEIIGVSDQLSERKPDPDFFHVTSFVLQDSRSTCASIRLNTSEGKLYLDNKLVEIPESLIDLVKKDTVNLLVCSAGVSNDLKHALFRADSCMLNSLREYLHPYSGDTKGEILFPNDFVRLFENRYKNYRKNDDQSYTAYQVSSIPKSILLSYYADIYGNFDKATFNQFNSHFKSDLKKSRVIKN